MMMQLNRDHIVVSKSGPSIQFKKGVPTHVPPRLVPEVLAVGGESVETDKDAEKAALAEINAAKSLLDERAPKVEAAVKALLARNQRGDFTAGGRPNLNVLFKESGLTVDAEELDPIWNKVKAEIQ